MMQEWKKCGQNMQNMRVHPYFRELLASGYQESRLRQKFELLLAQSDRNKLDANKGFPLFLFNPNHNISPTYTLATVFKIKQRQRRKNQTPSTPCQKDPVVERTDSSSVASTSTRKLRRPRKLELSNPTVCTCLFILFLIYIILCHTHRIGKNTALYKNADGICKSIKMRSTITCLADTTTLLTQAAPMILIVTATRVVQSVCTR